MLNVEEGLTDSMAHSFQSTPYVQSSLFTQDALTSRSSLDSSYAETLPETTPPKSCKDEVHAVEPQAIPQELITRPQWVAWRLEMQRADGRFSKVPYNPRTQRRAKVNDPSTWATFEVAYATQQAYGYDGVGFVLTADDPYIVLDVDTCLSPPTADAPIASTALLSPMAAELVERFQTYTEYSPSGSGLHLVLSLATSTGQRPVRKKPVEVLSANHFVTVTGRLLRPDLGCITACAEAFETWERQTAALHPQFRSSAASTSAHSTFSSVSRTDEEVLQAALRAKNG